MDDITLEKILDGYPLLYHLAQQNIPKRTEQVDESFVSEPVEGKVTLGAETFEATAQYVGEHLYITRKDNGQVYKMPRGYISSIKYDYIDYDLSEDITLVGNNKAWRDSLG